MITIGFILGLAFLLGGMRLVRGLIIAGVVGSGLVVAAITYELVADPGHDAQRLRINEAGRKARASFNPTPAVTKPEDDPWAGLVFIEPPADPQPKFNPRPTAVPPAPDAQLLDRWGTSAPDISWDEAQPELEPASPRANRLLRRLHEAQGVEAPL
jgi:hypothetical protein